MNTAHTISVKEVKLTSPGPAGARLACRGEGHL